MYWNCATDGSANGYSACGTVRPGKLAPREVSLIMVTMTGLGTIRIAAALLNRSEGRILVVRKRGTAAFMQPGGKIEPGEDAVAALCRELHEELGLLVGCDEPRHLGRFAAPAANEAGWTVEAEIFQLKLNGSVRSAAEIEETAWVDPSSPGSLVLAPLTRNCLLYTSRCV